MRRSTVMFNITIVIMLYTKPLPEAYRNIMAMPNIAVVNIMASRIYRNVNFQAHAQANGSLATDIKINGCQVASVGSTVDDAESRKHGAHDQENRVSFRCVGDNRA